MITSLSGHLWLSSTQCSAVSTCLIAIMEPPQMLLLNLDPKMDTMKGTGAEDLERTLRLIEKAR